MRTDVFKTSEAPPGLLERVRHLLDQVYEGNFPEEDWEHALGGWHVVVMDGDGPISHAAVVPRVLEAAGRAFQTGYVEGVGTAPGRQGQGLGTLAMTALVPVLKHNFEIGALSTGLHGFYERLGWERWRGPTSARSGRLLIRTEEDDDALMVLRFGPSLELDLTAPISCEARGGDPW